MSRGHGQRTPSKPAGSTLAGGLGKVFRQLGKATSRDGYFVDKPKPERVSPHKASGPAPALVLDPIAAFGHPARGRTGRGKPKRRRVGGRRPSQVTPRTVEPRECRDPRLVSINGRWL